MLLHAGLLQLRQAGTTSRCVAQASHCCGFSCCGAWAPGLWASAVATHWLSSCGTRALGCVASVVVAHGLSSCDLWALVRRLSSCGSWAQFLCGMWGPPRPGIEPMSSALAGRFLTTVPPGKSLFIFSKNQLLISLIFSIVFLRYFIYLYSDLLFLSFY